MMPREGRSAAACRKGTASGSADSFGSAGSKGSGPGWLAWQLVFMPAGGCAITHASTHIQNTRRIAPAGLIRALAMPDELDRHDSVTLLMCACGPPSRPQRFSCCQ